MIWFVWYASPRGPSPLKVFAPDGMDIEEELSKQREIISKRPLRATEASSSFDELERRYPPPREAMS